MLRLAIAMLIERLQLLHPSSSSRAPAARQAWKLLEHEKEARVIQGTMEAELSTSRFFRRLHLAKGDVPVWLFGGLCGLGSLPSSCPQSAHEWPRSKDAVACNSLGWEHMCACSVFLHAVRGHESKAAMNLWRLVRRSGRWDKADDNNVLPEIWTHWSNAFPVKSRDNLQCKSVGFSLPPQGGRHCVERGCRRSQLPGEPPQGDDWQPGSVTPSLDVTWWDERKKERQREREW